MSILNDLIFVSESVRWAEAVKTFKRQEETSLHLLSGIFQRLELMDDAWRLYLRQIKLCSTSPPSLLQTEDLHV